MWATGCRRQRVETFDEAAWEWSQFLRKINRDLDKARRSFPPKDSGDRRRVEGWLLRIADGRISIPFAEMDKSKAVPIAVWLAENLGQCAREWPDEAEVNAEVRRQFKEWKVRQLREQADALEKQ